VIATVVTAIAVCALALDTVRPPASAAEAGESTTGTASTISPSTVAVGGTLTYTLSGFPPGATIQISVDDDTLGAQGPGQSVIGTATVDDHGITSGAVELPIYLAKGSHWLRFGVSAGRDIPTSEVRTMDYTNKSPYFTVGDVTIIGGSDKPSPTDAPTVIPSVKPFAIFITNLYDRSVKERAMYATKKYEQIFNHVSDTTFNACFVLYLTAVAFTVVAYSSAPIIELIVPLIVVLTAAVVLYLLLGGLPVLLISLAVGGLVAGCVFIKDKLTS